MAPPWFSDPGAKRVNISLFHFILVLPINPSLSQSILACNQFTTKQTKSDNLLYWLDILFQVFCCLRRSVDPKHKFISADDQRWMSAEERMLLNLMQHKTWEHESKTNPSNVSVGVIARHPLYFPYLKKHLTSSVVEDYFSHLMEPGVQSAVTRWVQRVVWCDVT